MATRKTAPRSTPHASRVRKATPDDLSGIAALATKWGSSWTKEDLGALLTSRPSRRFHAIATDAQGKVTAFISASPDPDDDEAHEIGPFYEGKPYAHEVAEALVTNLAEQAKKAGSLALVAQVPARDEADIELFTRLGFEASTVDDEGLVRLRRAI